MSWLFRLLFPSVKSKAEHENDLRREQDDIVARYSRGNVRLQQGHYMTEEDADEFKREAGITSPGR